MAHSSSQPFTLISKTQIQTLHPYNHTPYSKPYYKPYPEPYRKPYPEPYYKQDDPLPATGNTVYLGRDESRHATRARTLKPYTLSPKP